MVKEYEIKGKSSENFEIFAEILTLNQRRSYRALIYVMLSIVYVKQGGSNHIHT